MDPFSIPWKHQKTVNRCIGNKWVNSIILSSKVKYTRPLTHFSPVSTWHFDMKCNTGLKWFFLIGIHSMQSWTATTRHGVTRKRSTKRLVTEWWQEKSCNPSINPSCITGTPPSRIRKWNQLSHFKWTSTKVIPVEKT